MFYHSEFIMVKLFPEVMPQGQDSVTVEVSKIVYDGAGVGSKVFGNRVASLAAWSTLSC